MVRDGRTLDHKTLEEIRRMAVERVQEGEPPSAVITSYGFCRTTNYKWLRKVKRGGRGDPLRSSKGTGRPPKLTERGVPLDQWQRSAPAWLRLWSVDPAHRRAVDGRPIWH